MAGTVISLLLALGMWATIWLLTTRRPAPRQRTEPGRLTPAERKRLYKRLGINPAALGQQRRLDVAVDPRPIARRSTNA